MDHLAFTEENTERIATVETLFRSQGKLLAKSGRVLVGEGQLMKLSQCRHRPQPKMFFLFNDILVYGSIVLRGRWYKKQQIIPLEDVVLENLDDTLEIKNQWLIRTPQKSFSVSAASAQEKRAWMEHIEECRSQRLQHTAEQPKPSLAAPWVPDWASAICMRCSSKFTRTHRRHHCRQCGFLVCGDCSRGRGILWNISPKPVRVCTLCSQILKAQDEQQGRLRGGSNGKNWSDDDELEQPVHEATSDEEDEEEDSVSARWSSPYNQVQNVSWTPFIYFKK